ncbi:hypothetical protein AC1031_002683 [Aphanomyces cochlioides]|nr:hypothetical protein AC1031_002683 [Aphanomyces cochlioides]
MMNVTGFSKTSHLTSQIMDRKNAAREEKCNKIEKRENDGDKIRDAALTRMKRQMMDNETSSRVDEDVREKKSKRGAIDLSQVFIDLSTAMHESNQLKRDECDLAKRKLALDEARYETEKSEREARLLIEKSEREARFEIEKRERECMLRLFVRLSTRIR